jgi:hypothetical protein
LCFRVFVDPDVDGQGDDQNDDRDEGDKTHKPARYRCRGSIP